MLNKTTTNNVDHHHHHNVIIGDILVHSESKLTIIQVVIQSLSSTCSSLTLDKPIIRRLSPNSNGSTGVQTPIPCDLKNTTTAVKVTHEKTKKSSSSKKIMRIQKAGVALVKEFKSKVVTPNNNGSKILTVNNNTDTESERTYF